MKKRFSLKKGVAFCTVSVLLRMLSESGPDIIVITGDLVDSTHTDIDTALAFERPSRSHPFTMWQATMNPA